MAVKQKGIEKVATQHGESKAGLELNHLKRDVKTALELAIALLAPTLLVDALATAAGLLEALGQFPRGSAPVLANTPRATELSSAALGEWQKWQAIARLKGSA